MVPQELRIADHTYTLPAERIAQHPLAERDTSKLLVYQAGALNDRTFRDLPQEIPSGALLVMNDTRVVNARLLFRKETGARIEVFCLEPDGGGAVEKAFGRKGEVLWRCALGNARRWKEGPLGQLFRSDQGDVQLFAERVPDAGEGALIRFSWSPEELSFAEVLQRAGEVPLPPYMHREAAVEDRERYQTVYAREEGSVAAPTAGLHFTPEVFAALADRQVDTARVTLHVGAGTFRPVHAETMADHAMHQERIHVPRAVVQQLHDAVGTRPVVVTGTTTFRTVESLYWHGVHLLRGEDAAELSVGQWDPYDPHPGELPTSKAALAAVLAWLDTNRLDAVQGATRLLIAPGYTVRMADALITNFHQPQSTLLLLVAAFIGPDWRRVYDHALANDYRFLSYGDSSLLWRKQ